MNRALVILSPLVLASCATLTTVSNVCSEGTEPQVCIGPMEVPKDQAETFRKAANSTISLLHTVQVQSQLDKFIRTQVNQKANAPWHAAWKGLTADKIATDLKSSVDQTALETYGGFCGLMKYWFSHNVATEGVAGGPIRLNRWALPRTSASIANTIAHEVSHKAGMRHPSSGRDLGIADCEPPYVVGRIVEQLITETTPDHPRCPLPAISTTAPPRDSAAPPAYGQSAESVEPPN